MVILHITDILKVEGNGVGVAVKDYASKEKKFADIAIYNIDDNVKVSNVQSFNYLNYKSISALPKPYNNPDLVIFNEVYKPIYLKLYKECLKNNIKYIVIPHGCLIKESQQEKRIKKLIGNLLFFNKFIRNANAVQFLNKKEKENTRFKYKKAIIIGNGIDISDIGNNKSKNKSLVYIGRYSYYIKGLDLMVQLCSKYREWFENNDVTIELYGRDSVNGINILKESVKKNDISNILKINGPVYGKEKKKVLEEAYGFIQLSRHEGQPMGIIEALAYGVPCIVTYGTSFGDYVNNNKCGYGCDFSIDAVFSNIVKLYDKNVRNQFSMNAKRNSINDFNWETIVSKTEKEYREIVYDI